MSDKFTIDIWNEETAVLSQQPAVGEMSRER
jgi:hypothetical protein